MKTTDGLIGRTGRPLQLSKKDKNKGKNCNFSKFNIDHTAGPREACLLSKCSSQQSAQDGQFKIVAKRTGRTVERS